jgi:biopolymer transport protein ExbB/TolQ
MQKKVQEVEKFGQKIQKASSTSGMKISEINNVLGSLTEIYRHRADIAKSEVEIKTLEVKEKVLLTEIHLKYETYNKIFKAIFDERKDAITKSFDIIDKGLADDDKDLISMGLSSLSTIVASSPFSNLKRLSDTLESGGSIEI